jgi:hypothetical protein
MPGTVRTRALICCAVMLLAASATASLAQVTPVDSLAKALGSPWLILPTLSSNPKLGTAVGALGAWVKKFDEKSRTSMIGAMYTYTTTHSQIAGLFARLSFGEDHHRITALGAYGQINNNYEDYLGSGQPLQTQDNLRAIFARYEYRLTGDWFVGAQTSFANYQVLGDDAQDQEVLESLGIRPFKSAGLGLVVMQDSRDNQDMPTRGWYLNANNVWYGDWFPGDSTYSVVRLDGRGYWEHGSGHVLAVRQYNWFTFDAPGSASASVLLRGYKQGQYLGQYMSSLEAEERFKIAERWGATAFLGAAYLYGGGVTGTTDENTIYPAFGVGIHYVLKPVQRMIANLEYAHGNAGNYGIYLKLGYAY